MTDHPTRENAALGVLLLAVSAIAFSTAGLFTRLVTTDVWTTLFWRGLFGGLFIAAFILARFRGRSLAACRAIGRPGLFAAFCSGAATICFISALRLSSVADVTLIFATAPFLAAAASWLWLGERPGRITLLASLLALAGVAVMFGGSLAAGHAAGNALALLMTALMAAMMVIIRAKRDISMLPASCLSAFGCAVAVAPLAHPFAVDAGEMLRLVLFGCTQFGLGLMLMTLGARLVSAARSSLISNLELPFAPFWVWLAFAETPALPTWIGGGIVVAAILLDLRATPTAGDA